MLPVMCGDPFCKLMTVKALISKEQSFCEKRDWVRFYNPKDLDIGISTEANELLDIFGFKSEKEIEEELSDTLLFVLRFDQMNHIDLGKILDDKIAMNAEKYSVDKIKGKNLKYTEI